jgi:hypothetical protein
MQSIYLSAKAKFLPLAESFFNKVMVVSYLSFLPLFYGV